MKDDRNAVMPSCRHALSTVVAVLALVLVSGCGRERTPESARDLLTVRTLGLAFLEENRLEEAEAEFTKLVAMAPDEALGYANLGLVYLRMGRFDEAENQIKQALEIEPNDADIRLILAKVYELTDRADDARRELEDGLARDSVHLKTLSTLAELAGLSEGADDRRRREQYLKRIVELAPANVAARVQLIEASLRIGAVDQAAMHMEEIRRQIPVLPGAATELFDEALQRMRASRAEAALAPTLGFHNVLRTTPVYQAGLQDLRGPGGVLIGFPVVTFSQDFSIQAQAQEAVFAAIRFTDITALVGLDVATPRAGVTPLALGDYDGDNDEDLFVGSVGLLFRNDVGAFVEVSADARLRRTDQAVGAIFADYDNDGWLDLYIAKDGPNTLLRNNGDGTFRDVSQRVGVDDPAAGFASLFLDADHDGDLDLYVANAEANRLYRNNLDGTFDDRTAALGVAGTKDARSRDVALGDFDNDEDIDLFVVNEDGNNILYSNLRQDRFEDVTARVGLESTGGSSAVTVGDYDNDGSLDLFIAATHGGEHRLYRNNGDGTFALDRRPRDLFSSLRGVPLRDATFFDYDNDGWLDLLAVGEPSDPTGRGVFLFRNVAPGQFDDVSGILPEDLASAQQVVVSDYGHDGDLDIFVADLDGNVRLLRNDGGDANRYLKVQLVGLSTGSGKNNHFGIGAKLEVRAGELYQMRVVTHPTTHFGLGRRLKADVVRIQWTNGVPQNLFYPGSDQDLVEEQTLKGSCAFLYAWDGRRFSFVTDVMWRSALGMPLGIMARGAATYAPPGASQEYVRIPGEMLRAQDGLYTLQVTEELWETAYFDEVKLLVVDHPDSVDILVDERFVPPAPAPLHLHRVPEKQAPVSASDDRGNDVLPMIREADDLFVANLTPTRYQGVTELHDLVLDFGDLSSAERVVLFLRGWIFPTDASINVAIAQSNEIQVVPPYLQVRDRAGRWQTVISDLGFPAGKNKLVVADLTGRFLSDDHRVRIRTNMEIYWDHVFLSTTVSEAPVRLTTLEPVAAELHARGYSRLYRKGGRYGPHWFAYEDVSTEVRWQPITGTFTRYGDVLSLLVRSEDRYVIMAPGDEVTLQFDASVPPALGPGWSRDFLIYTDGWIKDADLNTATGNTVEPLPFHDMSRYPYGIDESYPTAEEHRRYLREYNTRRISRERR